MSKKYNSKKKTLLGSYLKTNLSDEKKAKLKYSNVDDKWLENEQLKSNNERNLNLLKYSYFGDKRRVKIALTYENGADINFTDKNGNNALILSVYSRCEEVVKYLANYHKDEKGKVIEGIDKIDIDHTNKDIISALHLSSKLKNKRISRIILEAGGNPNVLGKYKETPIFESIRENDCAGIELLKSFGANLDHQNREGHTPVIVACQNRFRQEALLTLKKLGANFRIKDKNGRTCLMHAANNNNGAMMDIIIKACPDIEFLEQADVNGVNALMICAKRGNREATRTLLARGVNPFSVDKKGRSGVDYARYNNSHTCEEIILKAQKIYKFAENEIKEEKERIKYLSTELEKIGKQNRIQNSCCK